MWRTNTSIRTILFQEVECLSLYCPLSSSAYNRLLCLAKLNLGWQLEMVWVETEEFATAELMRALENSCREIMNGHVQTLFRCLWPSTSLKSSGKSLCPYIYLVTLDILVRTIEYTYFISVMLHVLENQWGGKHSMLFRTDLEWVFPPKFCLLIQFAWSQVYHSI